MDSQRRGIPYPVNLQATVEVYDCGCRIQYRAVAYGEFEGDLPETLVLVPELMSCEKHEGRLQKSSPPDARLVAVLHENESYLNE